MELFAFSPATLASFRMTLMRVSLRVFLLPVYGGEYIPAMVKAALCLILTLALWPHLSFPGELMPQNMGGLLVMLLGELILGVIMSLCVNFVFAAIQTGGQIMGFQMGFTMVTLADPSSGAQISISAHLLHTVALIVFLSLDGHLHLLRALTDSFSLIPPGGLRITGTLTTGILELSGIMFSLAIKIAAPVITSLFLA